MLRIPRKFRVPSAESPPQSKSSCSFLSPCCAQSTNLVERVDDSSAFLRLWVSFSARAETRVFISATIFSCSSPAAALSSRFDDDSFWLSLRNNLGDNRLNRQAYPELPWFGPELRLWTRGNDRGQTRQNVIFLNLFFAEFQFAGVLLDLHARVFTSAWSKPCRWVPPLGV